MDNYRVLLAIVLSMVVLLIYQFFFVPPPPEPQAPADERWAETREQARIQPVLPPALPDPAGLPGEGAILPPELVTPPDPTRPVREITVRTSLYTAVISEAGGVLKSFQLNQFRDEVDPHSPAKNLVRTQAQEGLPLFFSWGVEPSRAEMLHFEADRTSISLGEGREQTLTLRAITPHGLELIRTYLFRDRDYLIEVAVELRNRGGVSLRGAPYLTLSNRPFSDVRGPMDHFLFTGPTVLLDNEVHNLDLGALADHQAAGRSFTGLVRWLGYHDSHFFTGIIPLGDHHSTAHFTVDRAGLATTTLASAEDVLAPGHVLRYEYKVFFGPKTISLLREMGYGLERSIDFGWFDFLARPTLLLLNFIYGLIGNYGVAIILVTVLIKIAFWPLTHKGMKSMQVMQKIQPKMLKLREKFKDDKQRQQQEMIKLYQDYKVNPFGGCLPLILQIPVFFALYKVLLQSVEFRHSPFMLWINDLSAPDRLYIGFDLPWLGGIPVLTLLMGASMFIQQKMTPISDPLQAKIMLFLPVVFTFLFLNFASGLVLYWFVNNVLTILQQYLIYRQKD